MNVFDWKDLVHSEGRVTTERLKDQDLVGGFGSRTTLFIHTVTVWKMVDQHRWSC